ncbi:MAG: trypsin-like serine protease [Prevotella sp.]|nr:trypsin-like serine protease [Prevotella sp.]
MLTTASGFEHGNSGGPVFVERDGKSIVIGIVSAGAGRSTGFVVPISVVK